MTFTGIPCDLFILYFFLFVCDLFFLLPLLLDWIGWIFIEVWKSYLKIMSGKVRSKIVLFQRGYVFASSRKLGPLEILDNLNLNSVIEMLSCKIPDIAKIYWLIDGVYLFWRYPKKTMGSFQGSPFLVYSGLQFLSFQLDTPTVSALVLSHLFWDWCPMTSVKRGGLPQWSIRPFNTGHWVVLRHSSYLFLF